MSIAGLPFDSNMKFACTCKPGVTGARPPILGSSPKLAGLTRGITGPVTPGAEPVNECTVKVNFVGNPWQVTPVQTRTPPDRLDWPGWKVSTSFPLQKPSITPFGFGPQ